MSKSHPTSRRSALWLVPSGLAVLIVLAAIPTTQTTAQGSQAVLGCYVDTPNYDVPTAHSCSGPVGPSQSASFVVMGVNWDPSRYQVSWGSGCTSTNWNWCMADISPGQSVTVTAWVQDNVACTTHEITATATADPPEWGGGL